MELKDEINIDQSLFTPDGRSIICCKNRSITVLGSTNFLEISNTYFGNRVSDLKLSPGLDCLTLIEAADHVKLFARLGSAWEYDIQADAKMIRSPGYLITCAAISADTRVLVTAEKNANEHCLRFWNLDTKTVGQTISLKTAHAPITSLDFSPDANRLLARSGESLAILEKSRTGPRSWGLAPSPPQIPIEENSEPFAPKTKIEKKSQIYDDWKLEQRLPGTPGDPKDAFFISDGREIVYMQSNGNFHRNSKNGGQSGKIVQSSATAFALSNDERLFAFAGTKRLNDPIRDSEGRTINRYTERPVVYVCTTEKKKIIHTIAHDSMGKEPVTSLVFSLDSKRLFIGGQGGEIWTLPEIVDEQVDTKDGTQGVKRTEPNRVLKIAKNQGTVVISIFSPDGGEIVFGTDQGGLYCHSTLNVEERKPLRMFSGMIYCMKYGNNFSRLFVVDGTNKITVFSWDKHTGFVHRSEEDIEYPRQNARILSVACCRDKERLLVGGEGILDICNIKKRYIETALPVHGVIRDNDTTESVIALEFAPDGTKLFERKPNGSIQVWRKQSVSETFLPPPLVPEQISADTNISIATNEQNATTPADHVPTSESSIPGPSKLNVIAANKSGRSVVYLPEIPSVVHTIAVKQDETIRDGERNRFTLRKKLEKAGTTIYGDWYHDKVFSESRGEYRAVIQADQFRTSLVFRVTFSMKTMWLEIQKKRVSHTFWKNTLEIGRMNSNFPSRCSFKSPSVNSTSRRQGFSILQGSRFPLPD